MPQYCSASRLVLVMFNDNMVEESIGIETVVQRTQNYHCAVGKSCLIVYTRDSGYHEKRNSFKTGDPENSGLSKMQLGRRQLAPLLDSACSITYFKKYCSPARLFSRNLGLNLDMTLFGGSTGTAASKPGKVWISRCRRSSNSEYLLQMFMYDPYAAR